MNDTPPPIQRANLWSTPALIIICAALSFFAIQLARRTGDSIRDPFVRQLERFGLSIYRSLGPRPHYAQTRLVVDDDRCYQLLIAKLHPRLPCWKSSNAVFVEVFEKPADRNDPVIDDTLGRI